MCVLVEYNICEMSISSVLEKVENKRNRKHHRWKEKKKKSLLINI